MALGVPEDEIDAAQDEDGNDPEAGGEDERFGVWPQNERALEAFLLVRRQWRIAPMGGVIGLDFPGVESLLRMSKIEADAELLDDLSMIEGGVLEVWNAKQED